MPHNSVSWLRVSAEAVAIVASILLAFAIQAWWEGRQDRVSEELYVQRLLEELRLGLPDLTSLYEREREASEALDSLLLLPERDGSFDHRKVSGLVRRASRYEFNAGRVTLDQTYQEMLATGALGLISDFSIREAVTGYYRLSGRLEAAVVAYDQSGYRDFAERVLRASGTSAAEDLDDAAAVRLAGLVAESDAWRGEARLARVRIRTLMGFLERVIAGTESLIDELSSYEVR